MCMLILGIPLDAWVDAAMALTGIIATVVVAIIAKRKWDIASLFKVVKDIIDVAEDLKDAKEKEEKAQELADKMLRNNNKKPLTKSEKVKLRRKILRGD